MVIKEKEGASPNQVRSGGAGSLAEAPAADHLLLCFCARSSSSRFGDAGGCASLRMAPPSLSSR